VFIVGTGVFILALFRVSWFDGNSLLERAPIIIFLFFFILSSFPHTGDGAALLV
jgi:hypothetical protein